MEIFNLFVEFWSHRHEHVLISIIVYAPFVCLVLGFVITYLEHRDAVALEHRCAYHLGAYKDALTDFDREVRAWVDSASKKGGKL